MPNRLSRESSPYLLQHADNPVDWYPWGEEARARARAEDRPILLSVGYSACHWCHVMAHESFEDPDIAALMNASFVNVKVDREERPDVDSLYMRAVQAMTGHGGWPLTVFLTPEGIPYYGGTYFPSEPRHGMPSFRQVLEAVGGAYRDRPESVERTAEEVERLLERTNAAGDATGTADGSRLSGAARSALARFDAAHGGIGGAPKFPQPTTLEFLLHEGWRNDDEEATEAVLFTLRSMARGGIRDHLGGGFHRYSVDARWLVPHFEKMLYDNALLARLYTDGWRVAGDEGFRTVAHEILGWLLDDMRSPEGGFYAARDADSEGEEGRFYVWRPEDLAALDAESARLFARAYDVTEAGNFEGRSILHLPHPLETIAGSEGISPDQLEGLLAEARQRLLAVRAEREPPLRDEKILASWNGLTLRAFAEAGAVWSEPTYVDAAVQGAEFLLASLRPEERLLHGLKDGEARVPAFLDDHASLGNAAVSLYEVTLDRRWLDEARRLADDVLELFVDPIGGGLFDTGHDAEALPVRPRDPTDGATPSGVSLAAELFQRLAHLLGDQRYASAAADALGRDLDQAYRFPTAHGRLLTVASRELAPPLEIAVVAPEDGPEGRALLTAAHRRYVPGRVVCGSLGEARDDLPALAGRVPAECATAYVCEHYTCHEPVRSPSALLEQLDRFAPSFRGRR